MWCNRVLFYQRSSTTSELLEGQWGDTVERDSIAMQDHKNRLILEQKEPADKGGSEHPL